MTRLEVGEIALKLLTYRLVNDRLSARNQLEYLARLQVIIENDAPAIASTMTKSDGPKVTDDELDNLATGIFDESVTAKTASIRERRVAYHWLKRFFLDNKIEISGSLRGKFESLGRETGVSKKDIMAFGGIILCEMIEDQLSDPLEPEPPKPGKSPAQQKRPSNRRRVA